MSSYIISSFDSIEDITSESNDYTDYSLSTYTKNDNDNNNYTVFNNVHCFYYAWYGSKEINNKWIHWNHQILPDWRDKEPPTPTFFEPPHDIGADFYPEIGPYSSSDINVIHKHAQQFAMSGIGNAVISWYPIDKSDEQLKSLPGYSESIMKNLLEIFPKYNVKLSIHLEPYEGRNALSVRNDIEYIINTYSGDGLYLDKSNKPMIYIYDSYHTPANEWAQLLRNNGKFTIRNTKYDCTVIALFLENNDKQFITTAGFDGFYTYFGATGFTKGSTLTNWKDLSKFAKSNNLLFIPSVAPGYIDNRIRPWNSINFRERNNGKYYDKMWETAINCNTEYISVTSFNEWHEGTQIEPAKEYNSSSFTYKNYHPQNPDYYLQQTKFWGKLFNKKD